jgi:hypothetical protein
MIPSLKNFDLSGAYCLTGVLNPLLLSAPEVAATWTNDSFMDIF